MKIVKSTLHILLFCIVILIAKPFTVSAASYEFCIRDIGFSFPEMVDVKSYFNSQHQQFYTVSQNSISKFKFGFLSANQILKYNASRKSTKNDLYKFNWSANEALVDLAFEVFYEETGLLKNKRYEANLFFLIEDGVYLHFQVDNYTNNYKNSIDFVNKTLENLKFNSTCGNCKALSPVVDGLAAKIINIEGNEWLRGLNGADILLKNGPEDDLFLIWPMASEKHMVSLIKTNGELQKHYDFGISEVYDLVAHSEAFTILISHPIKDKDGNLKYNHLYLEKYDYNKNLIWSTHLMGVDEISKVGDQLFAYWGRASTKLVWSGEYYAAYFASFRKWPDLVTHQGDVFLTLTSTGMLMDNSEEYEAFNSTWDVSHSFAQELIYDGGKFFRLALGDAYPRAINVDRSYPVKAENYNWKIHKAFTEKFLDFPGEKGDNYVYDTNFGNALANNDQVLFAYGTDLKVNGAKTLSYGKDICNDLFLKVLDSTCKVIKSYQLSTTTDLSEFAVSIASISPTLILVKYSRINPKPKGVNKPNLYAGDYEEILGIFDLKLGKFTEKVNFTYDFLGEKSEKISLSDERKPYLLDAGQLGQKIMFSPLLNHKNGKIYAAKFLANGSGLQILEIEAHP